MQKVTENKRLADIKANPDAHRHDFEGLIDCVVVDGVLSLRVLNAHLGLFGRNGGVQCDVAHGPCACGAWH